MRIFQKYAFKVGANGSGYVGIDFGNILLDGIDVGYTVAYWVKFVNMSNPDYNNYVQPISFGDCSQTGMLIEEDGTLNVSASTILGSWDRRYWIGYADFGSWNFIVGTFKIDYDNGVSKLAIYKDGMLLGESSYDNLVPMKKSYVKVNMNGGNTVIERYYTLGEIRVYNRPLTEKEIVYLYKGGHIEDGLVFWLYPNEEDVVLDDDGQTVLQVTERINGYVGTAYNGVKLVDGKDIDQLQKTKKVLVVKRV